MEMPSRIGKYEILDVIGINLGIVYKARDTVTGHLVALKVFGNADLTENLLREVHILGMLRHPNIVVAYEAGEFNRSTYITMEWLDGEPLDSTIRLGTPLTLLQKIDIILQVSGALQCVHDTGIVHRDLKPHNIVLLRDGRVKLVGFHLACLASQAIAEPGKLVGTLAFMSPEALLGQPIDRRADIFSLGATFYELVDGNWPFEGAGLQDMATKILHEPPRRSKQAYELRLPELQAIFDKALAKQKDLRYQSCTEFSEDVVRLRRRLEREA